MVKKSKLILFASLLTVLIITVSLTVNLFSARTSVSTPSTDNDRSASETDNTRSPLPTSDFCENDSDCEVKNVGSCCGYSPACVNSDFEPDVEAVKQRCTEKGLSGICGFKDIDGCKCVNNSCMPE